MVPLLDPLAKARARDVEEVAVGRDDSYSNGGSAEYSTITRTRAACAYDDQGDEEDNRDRDDEPLFDEAWFVEVTPARPSRFTPATATEILTPHGLSTPIVADDPSKHSNTGNEKLNAASDGCTVRERSDERVRQQGAGQTEVQGHGVAGVWQRTLQQVNTRSSCMVSEFGVYIPIYFLSKCEKRVVAGPDMRGISPSEVGRHTKFIPYSRPACCLF